MFRLALLTGLLAAALVPLAHAQDIAGMARVTDSDKIVVDGARMILFRADAMDRNQTCTQGGQKWDCWGNAVCFL
jgi:endonuclease YncB( thermonuclease family)